MVNSTRCFENEKRYTDYDGFAWFYDRYWARRYHEVAIPALEKLLLTRLLPGSPVLDLCCGSGHLSRHLVGRGFIVTGLDGSEELLKYARANVPAGRFLAGDARRFSMPGEFQAALCTFDSLNHVLEREALTAVFANVGDALRPGGEFLFDLNMEEAYRTMWGRMSAEVEPDNVCIVRGRYLAEERLGRTKITTFRLADGWKRADTVLYQRCYSSEEVLASLEEAGFKDVLVYDARRDLQIVDDIGVGRMFFLAGR